MGLNKRMGLTGKRRIGDNNFRKEQGEEAEKQRSQRLRERDSVGPDGLRDGEVKGEEMAPGLQAESPGDKARETKGCSGWEAITATGSPALASRNKHTKPKTLIHTCKVHHHRLLSLD